MTVLHQPVDIDSEVYPELHELLASIGSSASREERLRQLATIGLIWERTRLQAQAGILEPAPAAVGEPVPAPPRRLPVLTDVVNPTEFSATPSSRVGANDPVHELPQAHQKAHRSRLKRMKEKGLFKNE